MRTWLAAAVTTVVCLMLPACGGKSSAIDAGPVFVPPAVRVKSSYDPYVETRRDAVAAAPAEKPYRDVQDVIAAADNPRQPEPVVIMPAETAAPNPPIVIVTPPAAEAPNSAAPASEPAMEIAMSVRPAPATPAPSVSVEPVRDTEQSWRDLVCCLEMEYAETPDQPGLRETLISVYLLTHQEDKAFPLLRAGNRETLDATANLITSLALLREGEVAEGMAVLDGFSRRLRQEMPLTIQRAVLADPTDLRRHPQFFGNYKPIGDQPLHPGDLAGIYTEAENFTCRRQEDDTWLISLHITAELILENGTRLDWKPYPDDKGAYELVTRSPIRDLCPTTIVQLPRELPEGIHTLRVTLRDRLQPDKKTAAAEIKITVLNR